MKPANLARIALVDATVIATLIDQTLTNLQLGQSGLPERTPGASPTTAGESAPCRIPDCDHRRAPCPLHVPNGGIVLTATERLGISNDPATRDLATLTEAMRAYAEQAAKLARICHQWGFDGITDTDVKTGLQERIVDLWCRNCAKAGISTVHRIGRPECAFCEAFRLAGACGVRNPNNHSAPKALLDIHFSRRINSGDITRTMTTTYGSQWNKKINRKGKGHAA